MKKLAGGRALGAAVLALSALLSVGSVAHARGGVPDAPRVDGVPAICSNGGHGNVVLNQSGKRITLAVSAQGVAAATNWRITVGDLGSGVVVRAATGVVGSQWTSIVNYEATKGAHTVVVEIAAVDVSNRYVAALGYKV